MSTKKLKNRIPKSPNPKKLEKSLRKKIKEATRNTPTQEKISRNHHPKKSRLKRIQRSVGSEIRKVSQDKVSSRFYKKKKKDVASPDSQAAIGSRENNRNISSNFKPQRNKKNCSIRGGSSASSSRFKEGSLMQESLGSEYMLRKAADHSYNKRDPNSKISTSPKLNNKIASPENEQFNKNSEKISRRISPESFQFSQKSSQNMCSLKSGFERNASNFRKLGDEQTLKESTKNLHNTITSKQSQFARNLGESLHQEKFLNELKQNPKTKEYRKPSGGGSSKKNFSYKQGKINLRISDNGFSGRIKREILNQGKYWAGTPKSKRVPLSSQREKRFFKLTNATAGSKRSQASKQNSQKQIRRTRESSASRQQTNCLQPDSYGHLGSDSRAMKQNSLSHRVRLLEPESSLRQGKSRSRHNTHVERFQQSESSQPARYSDANLKSHKRSARNASRSKKPNTRVNR